MSKFYCNVCEREVELKEGVCPVCKTDWDKISKNAINNEPKPIKFDEKITQHELIDEEDLGITDKDIDANINFFLNWGFYGKIIIFFLAAVFLLMALLLFGNSEGYSLLLIIPALICFLIGSIFENMLKWKSYMLYTNKRRKK